MPTSLTKQANPNPKTPAVVILAAGHSLRMGYPKAQLKFSANYSFAEQIIAVYNSAGISDISIVLNTETEFFADQSNHPPVSIIRNPNPALGRLYSAFLGISGAGTGAPLFIQNIDNPFVTVHVILEMTKMITDSGFVSPVYENRKGHPVLLSPEVLEFLTKNYTKYESLRDILGCFPCKTCQVGDPNILININTPDDYMKHFGTSIQISK
ncbi:MAG: NTP transferase domain-containing protein [Bacteroidetes bacterium]|nr:NTP transferase domain-containing protein [Bacteroidota bacterium]MBU1717847.1 NTP transferase domain-containing protein [Bacteroidota bacterium]